MPVISVIIPVYNAEKTLWRCVDSVLGQTFRAEDVLSEVLLEVLLVDDGSTDGSGSVAEEYARSDRRVKVFHQEHGGLSTARNRGLDHASGDWIAFVDADDWIEGDAFDAALAALNAHPGADLCAFGRFRDSPGYKKRSIGHSPDFDQSPDRSVPLPLAKEETVLNREEALTALIVDGTLSCAVWDKLYRASLFDGIRFPAGFNFEDIFVTPRLLMKADKIVLSPRVLYHYVQTAGSIIHTPSLKNALDRWTARREQFDLFAGKGPAWREACVRRCVFSVIMAWSVQGNASAEETNREKDRLEETLNFVRACRGEILRLGKTSLPVKGAALLIALCGGRSAFLLGAARRLREFLKPRRVFG